MSVESIITGFITDTPPGELNVVSSNIKSIIDDSSKNLSSAYEELIAKTPQLIKLGGQKYTIVSSYNKASSGGSKYVDYLAKKKFNVDLEKNIAIDIEELVEDDVKFDGLEKLADKFDAYLQDHFPSKNGISLIPSDDGQLTIIIIGEKLNSKNFYNGKWISIFKYDENSQKLTGDISIDVHYFEDGNVKLKTHDDQIEETGVSLEKLVNKISQLEDSFEKKLLINVSKLNEDYFKNLRRQLPINRSKIQWGKSIRNYKLGQDVVGSGGERA